MVDALYYLMENPLVLAGGIVGLLALIAVIAWLVIRGRRPVVVPPQVRQSVARPAPVAEMPSLMFATQEELVAGSAALESASGEAGGGGVAVAMAPAVASPAGVGATSSPEVMQPAAPKYRLRSQVIRQAFSGPIPKIGVSGKYRVAATLIGITMIILPLLYVAFVAAWGYGLYYYATTYNDVFFADRVTRVGLFLYITPLLAGGMVFLVLLAPLFVRMPRHMEPLELDPAKEPLVFCFVEEVCKAVGAPIPRVIRVDCEVNASAGLRRGLWSLFSSSDLALTIGLPLVANMDARQFAGLLAHEFGHFKQGSSVAMNYITRRVNRWFALVVYSEPDESIDDDPQADAGAMIIVWLAGVMMGIARGILKILMIIAHVLSCFLSRQQEYDADRYGSSVAGTDAYNAMLLKFPILAVGEHEAYKALRSSFRRFVLARDFAALVQARCNMLGEQVERNIVTKALAEQTGKYDTHPALSDRIDAVTKWNAGGILDLDRPASDLFTNFEELSAEITLDHYRMIVGPLVTAESCLPNDQYEERFGLSPANMVSMAGMR